MEKSLAPMGKKQRMRFGSESDSYLIMVSDNPADRFLALTMAAAPRVDSQSSGK
jgi:hypothetical protein